MRSALSRVAQEGFTRSSVVLRGEVSLAQVTALANARQPAPADMAKVDKVLEEIAEGVNDMEVQYLLQGAANYVDATAVPANESLACSALMLAMRAESRRLIWPAPTPMVMPSLQNTMALLLTNLATFHANSRSSRCARGTPSSSREGGPPTTASCR